MGVGGVLAVAAVLTVTTATTLVLHTRRHEIEIMRLVGAPEFTIRLPLVLQGGAPGAPGRACWPSPSWPARYRLLAPHLEALVSLTLGLPQLRFLTPATVLGLVRHRDLAGRNGRRPGTQPPRLEGVSRLA